MHRARDRSGEVAEGLERREREPDEVVHVHRVELEQVERGDERLTCDLVVHLRHLVRRAREQNSCSTRSPPTIHIARSTKPDATG